MPMNKNDLANTVAKTHKDTNRVKKKNKNIQMQGYGETTEVANNKAADVLQHEMHQKTRRRSKQ